MNREKKRLSREGETTEIVELRATNARGIVMGVLRRFMMMENGDMIMIASDGRLEVTTWN